MKLTEAQRRMLKWLASTDLEVEQPVVADALVEKGFASQLRDAQTDDVFYRITEAGRTALEEQDG